MTTTNLHAIDVPGINVYFVTVESPHIPNGSVSLYLAGDFSLSIVRKVQRLCADQYLFRACRTNSHIRMKRFRLGDYAENPQGLLDAFTLAEQLGERDTMRALCQRPQQVADLIRLHQPSHDDVWDRLAAEIQKAGIHPYGAPGGVERAHG